MSRQKVMVAVDPVILTIRDDQLQVLLIERAKEPYVGELALPGGFLAPSDVDLDAAARRKLADETGLESAPLHLEQVGAYGGRERDPRERVVAISYLAIHPQLSDPVGSTHAGVPSWHPVPRLLSGRLPLAFDHRTILGDAVERAREKLEHTTLATAFCPKWFTIGELRRVYEIVWGIEAIDPRNFHRKVLNTEGFVIPTTRKAPQATGRPAIVYQAPKRLGILHPPMLRDRH